MLDEALLQRRFNVLGKHSPLFYEKPLHLVRGEGVWLYDADGNRYLDAYNNVPHVGHCHPRVLDAIVRQASQLNTSTRYLHENVVEYGERLVSKFDASLSMAMFCCTGSEANELALRIARETTGNMGMICTSHSYHGNTAAVVQVSSFLSTPEQRGRYVRTIPVIDPWRDRAGRDDEALAIEYAEQIQKAIDDFHADGVGVAGLLLCTGLSCEGLPDFPAGYIARAVEKVRRAGGVFIADEVQGGFGRFGKHFWGHERLGVTPDIVTMGKPMGNGHPLAGVVARRELVEDFTDRNPMYFNTFAGNPVSCAAGMAVLDVIADEQLQENAETVGNYVLESLRALQRRHTVIGDVRGSGLFFAVELVSDRNSKAPDGALAKRVVNGMRERNVLISRIGIHDNILKIRPPMPFSRANAGQLIETLDHVLAAL
ncbi:aminotransferase class III-fold pyridoxal phosphate-dependent enzyme [Paraburkholderia saeva]|uniref:Isoleucine 2-epimerase n=1 Tax=Paraburkholderia saeva TaxID=2777537 RepID=A0A9N8RZT6_9BURK|nr:aminotransferase class III-fold pyridoxal phosphate-dependent enzyme [Paraburkholderia saeva]CAG4904342.1 Isoleucine 2-epimerase [Paraburkholderia saeva]CAG4906197.1 Isoleucine 2-epimerase [Paraburkholderia saeva]CAG4910158.1 Isoleucine 2-epimerase [Paraburkholderia saeva]